MIIRFISAWLMILLFLMGCSKNTGRLDGILKEQIDSEQTVLIFMNHECPICQFNVLNIRDAIDQFASKKVRFVMVFSGPYEVVDISNFMKEYNINAEFLTDSDYKIAKKLNAKVTPQAYVLDSKNGKILYNGCISDDYIALGQRKRSGVTDYLQTALSSIKNGQNDYLKSTKTIGCILEY